jgi:arylsulfatase A-like enzyme
MPTVLDLLGLPFDVPHDGISTLPLVRCAPAPADTVGCTSIPVGGFSRSRPSQASGSGEPSHDCAFREEAFAETMPAGWQALDGDNRRIWMVRTSDWKLIWNWNPDSQQQSWELYNLREDPGELKNVFAAQPLVANRLKAALEAEVARK